jgi:hypothetical protein
MRPIFTPNFPNPFAKKPSPEQEAADILAKDVQLPAKH